MITIVPPIGPPIPVIVGRALQVLSKKTFERNYIYNLYINLACLSECLSVCPINVKTAEQIGPKLCVGHHVTPGKLYE